MNVSALKSIPSLSMRGTEVWLFTKFEAIHFAEFIEVVQIVVAVDYTRNL